MIWQGKCPNCGWSLIWRRKPTGQGLLCKRCPGVALEWVTQHWHPPEERQDAAT